MPLLSALSQFVILCLISFLYTQQTFTHVMSTLEALEKDVNDAVLVSLLLTLNTPFSSVSIVDFEQVNDIGY